MFYSYFFYIFYIRLVDKQALTMYEHSTLLRSLYIFIKSLPVSPIAEIEIFCNYRETEWSIPRINTEFHVNIQLFRTITRNIIKCKNLTFVTFVRINYYIIILEGEIGNPLTFLKSFSSNLYLC